MASERTLICSASSQLLGRLRLPPIKMELGANDCPLPRGSVQLPCLPLGSSPTELKFPHAENAQDVNSSPGSLGQNNGSAGAVGGLLRKAVNGRAFFFSF